MAESTSTKDPHEFLRLLSRRYKFLEKMEKGYLERRDLKDELNVADSTVYKSLRDLRENGLIEKNSEGYTATLWGKILLHEYKRMEKLCKSRDIVICLGEEFNPSLLVEGELFLSEFHAPQKPLRELEKRFKDAEYAKGLAPVALKRQIEDCHKKVVDGGTEMEIVFKKEALDHIKEEFPKILEGMLQNGVRIFEFEGYLPFGLLLTDSNGSSQICTIAYDDSGSVEGIVVNDSTIAMEWAESIYSKYKQASKANEQGIVQS